MKTMIVMLGCVWVLSGCAEHERVDGVLALGGSAADGESNYTQTCAGCHGATGRGGSYNQSVVGVDDSEIADTVLSGKGPMPAYEDTFTDQQIADIIAYIKTL